MASIHGIAWFIWGYGYYNTHFLSMSLRLDTRIGLIRVEFGNYQHT